MLRTLRYQYPGPVYHLMARGDGGKAVFEIDEDRHAVEEPVRMKLRKVDGCKVLVACLVRHRTAVVNPWIAKRLAMSHSGSVSRRVTTAVKHPQTVWELGKLSKMLKCDT